MSCNTGGKSINKTFIIEPLSLTGGSPTLSACTTMFTNLVQSCSGDTSISLTSGLIILSGNTNIIGSLTAATVEATSYFSGGTNLTDIFSTTDLFITGGTYTNFNNSISLTRNDNVDIIITGLTDFYTTGVTLNNNILSFDRNDQLSAYTIDLGSISVTGGTFITGGTYNKSASILTLTRNDDVNIFVSGITDYYVTGGTYNALTENIDFSGNNIETTFSVDVSTLLDDTNIYITGFTYDNSNNLTIVRNDGSAFTTNISVLTGLTINGDFIVSGDTFFDSISATTYYGDGSNLTGIDNFYTTGATLINDVVYFDRNDVLSGYTLSLSGFSTSDIFVTGATFSSDTLTITRNDNFNITVTGFNSTDIYTTGTTLVGDTFYFDRNDQLSAYTISLSSFSSDDIYVSGGTLSGETLVLTRTDGNTVLISGFTASSTDFYTTGVTLTNNTLVFDRNDQLSAYTVDLSGIVATGATSGGTDTIRIHGSRNKNNQNNIFLRHDDGSPFNIIPYRLYIDGTISNVVASGKDLDTWAAHILTGTTVTTDSIYNLLLSGEDNKYDDSVNLNVNSGDTLYLYMSGTSVSYPTIDVYIKKR